MSNSFLKDYSSKLMLTKFSFPLLLTLIKSQNLLILEGVKPLLRRPLIVGNLGSSHPLTCLSNTKAYNLRLDTTVFDKFILLYSQT